MLYNMVWKHTLWIIVVDHKTLYTKAEHSMQNIIFLFPIYSLKIDWLEFLLESLEWLGDQLGQMPEKIRILALL